MRIVLTAVLILTSNLWTALGQDEDSDRQLLAGAAMVDVTPPLGEPIVGGWKPMPAAKIHDPLHARCLALDNGETRLAIVLCDNVGIPRQVFDHAKRLVREVEGLEEIHVLSAATHTHSATTARDSDNDQLSGYQLTLAEGVAKAVAQATSQLEPARVGWGSVDEPSEVFNRRWHVSDEQLARNPFGGIDTVRMNPPRGSDNLVEPAGPIDPEVSFVSVQSTSGRPIALLANYSLHYVGGVPGGEVSADYFAVFAAKIGELLGAEESAPPFVGIMSNGTSGDINNINFRKASPRREPYEKMTQVGELVARRVHEAHQQIEFYSWVKLAAAERDLPLRVRKPTLEQLELAEQILAKPADAEMWHRRERTYANRVKSMATMPDRIDVPLQAFRIGDVGIAAIPFEVFVEIGLEIKEKSPLKHTFTIELANGSYGYLPTPEQHELGGYETWLGTNRVEKQASRKIAATVLELLNSIAD